MAANTAFWETSSLWPWQVSDTESSPRATSRQRRLPGVGGPSDFRPATLEHQLIIDQPTGAQGYAFGFVDQKYYDTLSNLANIILELQNRPHTYSVPIYDLNSDEVELTVSPLTIVIEEYADEFVARFVETESYGSGNTEFEAIDDLRDQIVDLYLELQDTPDTELAAPASTWKRLLGKLVHG